MENTSEAWKWAMTAAARDYGSPGAHRHALTVVVQVPGCFEGAVYVPVAEPVDGARATPLAAALSAATASAPVALHVVWQGITVGPERTDVEVALTELSTRTAVEKLHISQSLGAVKRISEDSVLAIISQMRSIHSLARQHTSALQNFAQLFEQAGGQDSTSTITSTIDALGGRVRQFGQEVLDRTSRQARDVEQARVWTNDIVKLGQAIASIASNARILTFNARLESARIGEAGRGFAVIAGSIQDLATQVRQTNQSVTELAARLLDALPRLGAEATETSKLAKDALSRFESQLTEVQHHLDTVRDASSNVIRDTTGSAGDLQRHADEVLGHLQYQDRVSQIVQQVEGQAATVLDVAGLSEKPATVPLAHTPPSTVELF